MRGDHFKRTVQTAAKEHKCFAVCLSPIPKGEYYIKDALSRGSGAEQWGQYPTILMTAVWHLNCAPVTKASAQKVLEDAIKENAKHPLHTGAEHSDA